MPRLTWTRFLPLMGCVALLAIADTRPATAQAPPAGEKPPDPDQLLNNIVVVLDSANGRVLPKIGVVPSLAADIEDVTLRSVVRRDLDLSGEFEVLPDKDAPDALYNNDSPIDVKAWQAKGCEDVVRVAGRKLGGGKAELRGQAYVVKQGPTAIMDRKFVVPEADLRVESHRVADLLIGALTGQNGSFASHMTFASGSGRLRRIYTIDADGNDAKPVSPNDWMAIAPAYGKSDTLYFAAAPRPQDEFKIYQASSSPTLVPTNVRGSVYGIAFSKDRAEVALSVGVGSTIRVFEGPDFMNLRQASPADNALHPAFTPSGKLAFSGAGKWSQRVYVDGKAISPDGLWASSPTICNNPDGTKIVFAVGATKNQDLVVSNEKGGGLSRITQNAARNSYPACSPDGRLVAFFTSRKSNEGPGLYIMRVDGGRPKRVSPLLGDSLRWDPLPPGKGSEVK